MVRGGGRLGGGLRGGLRCVKRWRLGGRRRAWQTWLLGGKRYVQVRGEFKDDGEVGELRRDMNEGAALTPTPVGAMHGKSKGPFEAVRIEAPGVSSGHLVRVEVALDRVGVDSWGSIHARAAVDRQEVGCLALACEGGMKEGEEEEEEGGGPLVSAARACTSGWAGRGRVGGVSVGEGE